MNLRDLPIPSKSIDMIKTYEEYYDSFSMEMTRMSNSMFNQHVENYIEVITELAKRPGTPDVIRAAIGVLCLDRFGYHDFPTLARIFDYLVPQLDAEYAKFTSWCIGKVVHHPDLEKSRYVAHLFSRLIDWTRSRGRRARPLAAATLLESLSANAGSNVVSFFGSIQTAIWSLLSNPSLQVLQRTAQAISMYTRAIIRYGRSDLSNYMWFFKEVCAKLLESGDTMREYAALSLYEVLINQCPSYFVTEFIWLYKTIYESCEGEPALVTGQGYVALSCLSQVDPKQFMDFFAEGHIDSTPQVLLEFPASITKALVMMCKTIPEFMEKQIPKLLEFVDMLAGEEEECAFTLLTTLLNSFGARALPSTEKIMELAGNGKLSEAYVNCMVALTSSMSEASKEMAEMLCTKIINEAYKSSKALALNLLSRLPSEFILRHEQLNLVLGFLSADPDQKVRQVVPKAWLRLVQSTVCLSVDEIYKKLLQIAIFDDSVAMRSAVLEALCDHPCEMLANPDYMKFWKMFTNDDSPSVRSLVFRLLSKIAEYNPMAVTQLTRSALLDSFFILRNIPGVRQRSTIVRYLPDLVKASELSIKAYSDGLMDIIMEILNEYNGKMHFENFLEEDSQAAIMIGVMHVLILLLSMDPERVSKHGQTIIDRVCNIALTTNHRVLAQRIFRLLHAMLSAPGSNELHRAKTPLILSTCSTFLASTRSRKARMTILHVLGAIGALEVHQRTPTQHTEAPESMDDDLARQFFRPTRDMNSAVDESLLLSVTTTDQYYSGFTAVALMELFKDDNLREYYDDIVSAFVQVLQYPRMHILGYFDAFVSRLLDVLETSSNEEVAALLPYFTQLISNSTHNTSPFLERSLQFIKDRFCMELTDPMLDVILAFLSCIRDGFSPYASDTICLLVVVIDDLKTTKAKTCEKALAAFTKIIVYSSDLLYLMVPRICDAIMTAQTLTQVRISSLNALREMTEYVDMNVFLGTVVRAVLYSIRSKDHNVKEAGFNLLYTILKSQGLAFLINVEPLLSSIRREGLETAELRKITEEVSMGEWGDGFKQLATQNGPPPPPPKPSTRLLFAEDAVMSRVQTSFIGSGRLDEWLRTFTLSLITNSPSQPIRACSTLVTSYQPLGRRMFNVAFLSCWLAMSDNAKEQICSFFTELLSSGENYESVARDILGLLVFMDRIEKPLNIPDQCLVKASIRYGRIAYALRLLQQKFRTGQTDASDMIMIVDLLSQLGDWPSAKSVWERHGTSTKISRHSKLEVLSRLHMWDQIEPVYQNRFEKMQDFESFCGLSKSLAALAMWPQMMKYMNYFQELETPQKRDVAPYLAEAALHLGEWSTLDEILQYVPDDSARSGVLSALAALHSGKYTLVDDYINKSFSLLASRPIKFWANNQQIHQETMRDCQQLVEVAEMAEWVQNKNRKEIENVWATRMRTAPHEWDLWFNIIGNRLSITNACDDYLINWFLLNAPCGSIKSQLGEFDALFPDFKFKRAPDVQKLCYVVAQWNSGNKKRALRRVKKLTDSLKGDLLIQARLFYTTWLLEEESSLENLKDAYNHFRDLSVTITPDTIYRFKGECHQEKDSVKHGELVIPSEVFRDLIMNTTRLDALRKWSDVNVALIEHDPENRVEYVTNGITSLSRCIAMSPSFADVVQLLHLFFDNAENEEILDNASPYITAIRSKLLLQAAPQILIQLNQTNKKLRSWLLDFVFDMLLKHYHDLIFSLAVLKFSRNPARSKGAQDLLDRMEAEMPDVCEELTLIRTALLRAAVTWSERASQKIGEAFDHYKLQNTDGLLSSLRSILSMVKEPKCEMHRQFVATYRRDLNMLEQMLRIYSPDNHSCAKQLAQWCRNIQEILTDEVKKIRIIQLDAVCPELADKDSFTLAVPGTYHPEKPVCHIKYFVGQFSVYMSKQQPKDVIVKGEDGNFYQYLLKGHEDLRLDERIMQFFRLINSILKKNAGSGHIQTVSVIPLSMSHGLVQWATGTDTLRAVVEQYRRLHNQDPMIEYDLMDEYTSGAFDLMLPFQKQLVFEKICERIPDRDIAEFFWLKAGSSEAWWKQTSVFTTSTATMSIVGYVIGLGDRHPSNLLIDKSTGRVVHIDFGDCFEKAALRKYLPEVVPFRLTRMMVAALGVGGVDGLFRSTFVNMSHMLRNNRQLLEMVLSIFVHEPLIDPDTAEDISTAESEPEFNQFEGRELEVDVSSSVEMRQRIRQKLTGTDFPDRGPLSVEEQTSLLIESATDVYQLSKMYSGWCPFW